MLAEQDVMASDRLRSYIESDRDRLVSCAQCSVTSSSEATSGASSDMLIAKHSGQGHLRFGDLTGSTAGRMDRRIRAIVGPQSVARGKQPWFADRSHMRTGL